MSVDSPYFTNNGNSIYIVFIIVEFPQKLDYPAIKFAYIYIYLLYHNIVKNHKSWIIQRLRFVLSPQCQKISLIIVVISCELSLSKFSLEVSKVGMKLLS